MSLDKGSVIKLSEKLSSLQIAYCHAFNSFFQFSVQDYITVLQVLNSTDSIIHNPFHVCLLIPLEVQTDTSQKLPYLTLDIRYNSLYQILILSDLPKRRKSLRLIDFVGIQLV